MTEIPAHLLQRAREARRSAEAEIRDETPKTVEVPVHLLELLKEWHERGRDTPFTSDGLNVVALFQNLINLIPKPAYEPSPSIVQEYAHAQEISTGAARNELIQLHRKGLTVSFLTDSIERN